MDGLTSTCSWNGILAITIGITIYARRLVLKAESKRQDPEAVPPCCIVGSLTEPRCKSRSQDDGSSQIHQDACSVRLRSATQSRLVKLESRNQGEADTPKNRGRSAGRVRPRDVTPLALIRITDASASGFRSRSERPSILVCGPRRLWRPRMSNRNSPLQLGENTSPVSISCFSRSQIWEVALSAASMK